MQSYSKDITRFLRDVRRVCQIADGKTSRAYLSKVLTHTPQIIRTRSLGVADKAMSGIDCTFTVAGKEVRLSGTDFGLAREICCRQVYFALPEFKIGADDMVIDLGANTGVFTVLAALLGKKVISVECQGAFISEIEANLKKNECVEKVVIEFGLVGGKTGVFSDVQRLVKASHYTDAAPVLVFEDMVKRNDIRRVDFLKVDIEGSEFDLFSGRMPWLSMVSKIAMEVHQDYGDIDVLRAGLESNGFNVWFVNNQQQIVKKLTESQGFIFAARGIHQRPNVSKKS